MITSVRDVLKMFMTSADLLVAVRKPPVEAFLQLEEEITLNEFGNSQVYPAGTYVTLSEDSVYPSYYTPEEFNKQYETK